MTDDDDQEPDTFLPDHAAAARAINAALHTLHRKCARTAEIKRSVTRDTLCCMVVWQAIEMLGIESTKPTLLTALAAKIGYAEARRLIDQDERELREAEDMAQFQEAEDEVQYGDA